IIRHLGVIAVPIESDVLAVCPALRRTAKEIIERKRAPETPIEQREREIISLISKALDVLCRRALVFRIKRLPSRVKNRSEIKKGSGERSRYAVHKLVQVYVYRQLSVQPVEPTEGNFFSVSVYASQQVEQPTLTASAYGFVNELIDQLIR